MLIYIHDNRKKRAVQINLNIEFSIPCNDTFVIFENKNEVCRLNCGADSVPYDTYCIKKISHTVTGNLQDENGIHTLTIAFYNSESNGQCYFILNQLSENGYVNFRSVSPEDFPINTFKIMSLSQYNQVRSVTGKPELNFAEYLNKLFFQGINANDYTFYNVSSKPSSNFSEFLTPAGFNVFLDEEEKIHSA